MKNLFPFFAACLLLTGSACSTYSSNTDPNDLGSGSALQADVDVTPAPEAHPTPEADKVPAKADSAGAPAKEAAAPAAH